MGVLKDIFDNVNEIKDSGACRFSAGGHCNSFGMQCPWLGISLTPSGVVSDTHACCKPEASAQSAEREQEKPPCPHAWG